MSDKLPLPFDDFVQEPKDKNAARRIAAFNAPVIEKNETQIVSALTSLLGQLPGHGAAQKKTFDLAREQFEKTRHLFLRHEIFAAHPWLIPYAIAARMNCHVIACGAMQYHKRFHTEALPHLTEKEAEECERQGLKFSERKHGKKGEETALLKPRKQRLFYQDVDGISQKASVPSLLMMGYQNRNSFNRACEKGMESLFIISHEALCALADVMIDGMEKTKATPLDHLIPARELIEEQGRRPPSPPRPPNAAQVAKAYAQGVLPGFFKPPRP